MQGRTKVLTTVGALTLFSSGAAVADSIDQWEPVKTGAAVPTVAAASHRTRSVWLGYGDGQVYFSGSTDSPSWSRMDKNVNMGVPFDMQFQRAVTAIATNDTFDDYVAYVGFNSDKSYSQLFACTYNRGGIHWRDLSAGNFVGLQGISTNPLDPARIYVATSAGVRYSLDAGTTWQDTNSSDPLTPPSGTAISAIASSSEGSADRILVGGTNGEVWAVSGARSGSPSWLRIDQGRYVSLPARTVTRLQIDERDLDGKTFLAVFGGASDGSMWITRTGGQFWSAVATPVIASGNPHPTMLAASLAPAAGVTTFYGQALGFGGVRSDDNGQTWFQTPRWSGRNLAVEYKHIDRDPYSNQLMPSFRVRNMGSVDASLAGLTFQYLFTPEGSVEQSYYCDWSPYGCSNVRGVVNGGNLSVVLASVNATVAAGQASGEIQGRVAKSDWSAYDQTNDFSFITGAYDWTLNPHVQLLDARGAWLWGTFAQ